MREFLFAVVVILVIVEGHQESLFAAHDFFQISTL